MNPTIALLLRSLAGAVTMPELFGGKAAKLEPVLSTLASIAEVPEAVAGEHQALLDTVQRWVDTKTAPTDAELDQFKAVRDARDQQTRDARAFLDKGGT